MQQQQLLPQQQLFGGVTSAVVIPPIIEEHKLTKNVEANLDMLVSSNYKAPNEEKNEVINEIIEENKQEADNSKPLTFRVERQEVNNDNLNGVEFVIIPSYDKDFSQWSKEEKEAYSLAIEEAKKLTIEEGKKMEAQEEQKLEKVQEELNKIMENDWVRTELTGAGYVEYNQHLAKVRGNVLGESFEASYQEFLNSVSQSIQDKLDARCPVPRNPTQRL